VIPDDENVIISTNKGQPVAFDAKSKSGQAFTNIAKRLKGQDVPFIEFDGKDDLFSRLFKSN
jgi:septum site-determining protein MinD